MGRRSVRQTVVAKSVEMRVRVRVRVSGMQVHTLTSLQGVNDNDKVLGQRRLTSRMLRSDWTVVPSGNCAC